MESQLPKITASDIELNSALDNALDSLGADIRELRRSRQMTVRKLASLIGRSVGFVSQVERNHSKPSLKDLYAIAAALDVQINWFLQKRTSQAPQENGKIVRETERRWMENEGIRTEVLSPQLGEGVEFMQATYQPGAKTQATATPQPGTECGLILSGRLNMWIDGELFHLHAGDSYQVRFEQRYHSCNPSDTEETVIVWTAAYH